MESLNSFNSLQNVTIDNKNYNYFDLNILASLFGFDLSKIPNSIKIILENLIRNEDGESVTREMISNLCKKINESKHNFEISFSPTRVLMQDFTGVPAVADLAAMRDALKYKGLDPNKINPFREEIGNPQGDTPNKCAASLCHVVTTPINIKRYNTITCNSSDIPLLNELDRVGKEACIVLGSDDSKLPIIRITYTLIV